MKPLVFNYWRLQPDGWLAAFILSFLSYLFERIADAERDAKTEIFHPLVNFPDSWGKVSRKPGVWNCIKVAHLGGQGTHTAFCVTFPGTLTGR